MGHISDAILPTDIILDIKVQPTKVYYNGAHLINDPGELSNNFLKQILKNYILFVWIFFTCIHYLSCNSPTYFMLGIQTTLTLQIKGQLNISTGEFQVLSRQLDQVSMVMDVLDKLTKAQQMMETIRMAKEQGNFVEAARCCAALEQAMSQAVCENDDQVRQ